MQETWIDRQEAEEKALREKPFDSLPMPKRNYQDTTTTRYKVWSDSGEVEVVDALTASQALQNCSFDKPVKLERYMQSYELHVEDESLTDAIDVYVRPVIEQLTQKSPVIEHETLHEHMELVEPDELQGEVQGAPSTPGSETDAPANNAADMPAQDAVSMAEGAEAAPSETQGKLAQDTPAQDKLATSEEGDAEKAAAEREARDEPSDETASEATSPETEESETKNVSFEDAMKAPSLKDIVQEGDDDGEDIIDTSDESESPAST